jgi:hypothetical protein
MIAGDAKHFQPGVGTAIKRLGDIKPQDPLKDMHNDFEDEQQFFEVRGKRYCAVQLHAQRF